MVFFSPYPYLLKGRLPLSFEGLCRNMKKTDIFQRGKGGRVEKI
jgi:hypothetical protein